MNEHESYQPPDVNPSDEATIRELMDVKGLSFDEARKEWEMTKANVNKEMLDNKEQNNG